MSSAAELERKMGSLDGMPLRKSPPKMPLQIIRRDPRTGRITSLSSKESSYGRLTNNSYLAVSAQDTSKPYGISVDMIKHDLTNERPAWPLSCYGPGKNAPVQLIEDHTYC